MAAIFKAGFTSPCAVCERPMVEGTDVTWLNDEVVHLDCAEDPDRHRPIPDEVCTRCFMTKAVNGACGCID